MQIGAKSAAARIVRNNNNPLKLLHANHTVRWCWLVLEGANSRVPTNLQISPTKISILEQSRGQFAISLLL